MNNQYRQEQLPPSPSWKFSSRKPEQDASFCPAEVKGQFIYTWWRALLHTVNLMLQPLGNLGYATISQISHSLWSHLHELSWNISHPPFLTCYLLLGNKPTFSVDFNVTKEGICFSSWIFKRIGCRTPQNIDKIPSINGLLPSRCWGGRKN